jgi:hypothetical protein
MVLAIKEHERHVAYDYDGDKIHSWRNEPTLKRRVCRIETTES